MAYTREQYSAAIRRAYESGDTAAANELAEAADAALGVPQESEPDPMFADYSPADVTPLPQAADDFIVGMGKGMTDVGRGVQDLWHRGTGNDDALDRLTKKAEQEDAMFERDLGDSGWATGGQIAGEVAATLPIGMGVAGGAARLGKAAYTGTVAATEGALAEGMTQRGGAAERGTAAAMGAVGGKVSDMGLKLLARRAGKLTGKIDDPVDATARERMAKAAKDGGYQLDAAQATQNTDALFRRNYLNRKAEGASDLAQKQEADILAKTDSFLSDFGGERNPFDLPKDARVDAADRMAQAVRKLKNKDQAEVDRFYTEWREAMGDEPIPLPGMREAAEVPFENASVAAKNAVGDDVQEVLNKYFVNDLNKGADLLDAAGNPMAARKTGLTVGSLESVRQELNELWRDTNSTSGQRFINQVKDSIDEHVSLSFQKLSDDGAATLNMGRKATERYKQMAQDWPRQDFITKIAEEGADGEGFRQLPMTSLNKVLGAGKAADLQKVKNRMALHKDPEVREAWNRMQQVPLIEAIDNAMRAGKSNAANIGFSTKRFRTMLGKYDTKELEVLWGKDKLDEIKSAMDAWDLKDAASTMEMQAVKQNPSGTANVQHNVMSAGVRIGAGLSRVPMVGPLLLAIPAAKNAIAGVWGNLQNDIDVTRLARGQLPAGVDRELRKAAVKAFGEEVYEKYPDAAIVALRNGLREYAQHNNDNE